MHLFKLDDTCYSQYQRLVRKLEPSINVKGKPPIYFKGAFNDILDLTSVPPKPMFIDTMHKSEVEIYFLRNDENQNIGIAHLVFYKDYCKFIDFALISEYHGRGIGTKFLNMLIEEVIKPKQYKVITLKCPYPGAQQFYLKLGFEFVMNKERYINPTMRKLLT